MKNYFNFKKIRNDEYLITNDFGRYAFINKKTLYDLVFNNIDFSSETGKMLESNLFAYQCSDQAYTEDVCHAMRDSKNYVFNATSLHIFVVTTACNMNCVYCQANNGFTNSAMVMDIETAEKAVDIALSSPSNNLSFEFQGGEPLMNFPVIRHIVEYTYKRNTNKNVEFSIVTNLSLINDEILDFFVENNISVSTSLDGHRRLHNMNRPYANGTQSFDDVICGVAKLRDKNINVGAIQTTTRASLHYANEIVETYCELGFDSIFIRPLTPLGKAKKEWSTIGYSPNEFSEFYNNVLDCIITKNANNIHIKENHASIFLSKIIHGFPVNYMELRSPCGAVFGQVAYYPNGDIFTCDEGRMLYQMGISSFKLGNVFESRYEDITGSSVCKTICKASVTESVPGCSNCVYQPYCGVCPVVSLALQNDIIPKNHNHYRCMIYSGMLDTIFACIRDPKKYNIIKEW